MNTACYRVIYSIETWDGNKEHLGQLKRNEVFVIAQSRLQAKQAFLDEYKDRNLKISSIRKVQS